MEQKVILVNQSNSIIGKEDKDKVHKCGILHKAFTIYIFNNHGDLLLQKRSNKKSVGGRLWTNTCCGHYCNLNNSEKEPSDRLNFEMGITCKLKKLCTTVYKIRIDKNSVEHEYGEFFIGIFNGNPKPNKTEVEDFKWISFKNLLKDIETNPQNYTAWFVLAISKLSQHLNQINCSILKLYKKIDSKSVFHVSYPKI